MAASSFSHITCQLEGGVVVITLLDAKIQEENIVEELRKELLSAAAQYPTKKWVLDFQLVQVFSSTGIRPLLTLHRKIQGSVGRMVFCNLQKELLDIFLVTRLISPGQSSSAPFELAKDLAEALAKLRHYTVALVGDILVFTIIEENLLGDDLADELTLAMEAAVAEKGVTKVILDFQHVQAISTPGLRPMLHLRNVLRNRDGCVVLAHLSSLVKDVLSVTRLVAPNPSTKGLFDSYGDTESALAAFTNAKKV